VHYKEELCEGFVFLFSCNFHAFIFIKKLSIRIFMWVHSKARETRNINQQKKMFGVKAYLLCNGLWQTHSLHYVIIFNLHNK
jgi:hypothetical protein